MKTLLTALAAIGIARTSAYALAFVVAGVAHAYTASSDRVRIVDGDTIVIGLERIRLKGPDAPESFRARCANELSVALRAKQRLRELLSTGPIRIQRHGHDRYGRTLANVFASDGSEVGATLIKEGLAVEWKSGRAAWQARTLHWCPASPQAGQ